MAGLTPFQVSNPPQSTTSATYDSTNTASTSTPLPPGVTFKLSGINGQDKGKVFAFQSDGSDRVLRRRQGRDGHRSVQVRARRSDGGRRDPANGLPSGSLAATRQRSTGLHSTKSSNGFNVASIATFC